MQYDLIDTLLNTAYNNAGVRLALRNETEGELIFQALCERSDRALARDIYYNCHGQLLLWIEVDMG